MQNTSPAHSHTSANLDPAKIVDKVWHTLDVREVMEILKTDPAEGLCRADADERLAAFGRNELKGGRRTSALRLLASQFKNLLVIILLVAIILSFWLGHTVEATAIGIIVLFSVVLGFLQEYRAEKAIEALKRMSAPTATVIRDGEELEVAAVEIVPGDIIIIGAGDRIPADSRIIESVNMQIDESALTGESVPVEKTVGVLAGSKLEAGDRTNMAFAGTLVTYGRGMACVTSIGMQTEFGQIARMLESVESGKTPLQRNLDRLGKILSVGALIIVLVIVSLGIARGQPILEMLLFGIALAVAVVPEALPAVVTISLALGVQRMAKRHALVRRLPVVETLGSTTVICSDKTGTLTKDEMTARRLYLHDSFIDISGEGYEPRGVFSLKETVMDPTDDMKLLLRAAVLASDAHLHKHEDDGWGIRGDPTEGALIVAAEKAGILKHELDQAFPRIGEIPFTSESKRMTTLHRSEHGNIAYAKGAPEILLAACSFEQTAQGIVRLSPKRREEILTAAAGMAKKALRVLAVTMKEAADIESAEGDEVFLGLFGIIDPPRAEAKQAIRQCLSAGIRPIMITGDHPVTAAAIAEELELLRGGRTVTGAEIEAMSDETLEKEIGGIDVFARVSPIHKLRVVTALQKNGEVVAMTGDGVNDAPALKKADIGIAMGITGTDVSKEAAAMLLTDDNFASIVHAVEEGRGIFGNIKKYLMYLLSANLGEIGIMTLSVLLGLPLPLSAIQILYINLATDGLPALALAVDPPEKDLMKHPPRNPDSGIFTRRMTILMLISSTWSIAVNVGLFGWLIRNGGSEVTARTAVFTLLVLIEFFKAYNFRSDHLSAFQNPFSNKWLNLAIIWEVILLAIILFIPFLRSIFDLTMLTAELWIIIVLLAASIVPVLEAAKVLIRHRMLDRVLGRVR